MQTQASTSGCVSLDAGVPVHKPQFLDNTVVTNVQDGKKSTNVDANVQASIVSADDFAAIWINRSSSNEVAMCP